MSSVLAMKYDGTGITAQRIFIKDARVVWEAILSDLNKHLMFRFTQFDYLETLGAKLTGQARRILDNWVEKWDYKNLTHENNDEALLRETERLLWR